MKHYPHHIGDFDRATRHLTRIERSVYRDLLDLYYDTEQQLTLDVAWLCRKIIARTNEESTAVEQTLNEFFTKTQTGWFNERCEEEIQHYRNNNSQKAQAGKASAAAKALKKQQAINARSTDVVTDVEQTNNGTPTNHQPSTINHQPLIKDKAASPPFVLPDWINAKHWDTWHSTPKRKKATTAQKQMAVDKMDSWRKAGDDYAGALENAAIGGNQGLFLPNKPTIHAAPPETFKERDARLAREKWERMTGEQHPDNNPAAPSRSILDVVDVEMKMIGAMQ